MKLINYTLLYLSIALFFIIGIWAGVFYLNMLDEIYDSIDDGLKNSKMLIIQKAKTDSSVLSKDKFDESNYAIRKIDKAYALAARDSYSDTMMYMAYEEDLEPVRLLTSTFVLKDDAYYEVKVISSMVEEDDLIEDLLYAILWLYIILVISVLLVNNIILKRAWKPFYQLISQLQKFRLGKNEQFIIQQTKVAEFKLLNETVERLLKQNLETYTSQKQFIENAAHELQTPLAISINKLELLAEKIEAEEEQLQTVGSVIQTLERLTRLNKSLLLLSKIENRQFISEEKVNLNSIVNRLVEDFTELALFKKVTLHVKEEADCLVTINKDLAEILVTNVLKNAIVHNIPGGDVAVTISTHYFTVENTGSARKLDTEKLFNRFYKESVEKTATGLGLSIVKAIVDLYNGKIAYAFSGKHQLTIRFE